MQPLLQMQNIDKQFPGVKALSGASLSVYPGRVMALLGENGAGKSTLMKVLTGIYSKDAGSINYQDQEVAFNGPKQSQEAGISIIHQELNLIPGLTIAENIFLGREFVTPFGRIDWKKMYDEADKLLARLKVPHSSRKLVGELSIGTQQMVEIAKALSFSSRVIIMDEPTDALTDTETEALFSVIRELRAEGRGIVYISHRLKEIFEICDDVTVLRDGQFIAERTVASLDEDSLIEMMVGRRPATEGLNLDAVNVSRGDRGEIIVDEHLRTSNPRIWAAGDVTGMAQLVYVASAQGTVAASNALGNEPRSLDYTALPRVIFTSPEMAAVGMTPMQAEAAQIAYDVREIPVSFVLRAIVSRHDKGIIKMISERETGRILGIHMVGESAGEVIAAATYIISAGLTVDQLAKQWSPYFTMAESLKNVASSAPTLEDSANG